MAEVDALNNYKFYMKHYQQQKWNLCHSRPETNEKYLRQVLHRKLERILSATDVENLDTLVSSVTWNIPLLRRTGAFIRLYNTINKMKTMESLKPLKKTVPPLTLVKEIAVVEKKKGITITTQDKLSTWWPEGCVEWITTRKFHPSENSTTQVTSQTQKQLEPWRCHSPLLWFHNQVNIHKSRPRH